MAFTSPSNKPAKGSKPSKKSDNCVSKKSGGAVSKQSTTSKATKPTSFKGSQNATRVEKQW